MKRPTIVCLCGSTRFKDVFVAVNASETMAEKIVLSVGWFSHADGVTLTANEKARLDELHLRKIDLADEVLILNVGGYVGESTQREIAYAYFCNKDVRWLEREAGEQYVIRERHKLGRHVAGFMDSRNVP